MKQRTSILFGIFLFVVLAVGAVKTLVIVPRTVADTEDILDLFYAARSSLPPLPPPVDYRTVASQLSESRFDFLSTPDWAFTHSDGTLYLSEKSKLKLSLPMQLVAYEDLVSGKVVLTGTAINSKRIQTLAIIDAPEFAEQKSGQTVESWLMKEIGPRRIIWTALLKPEEEAWADLLSAQEQALAAPMMMTMSISEPITDFRVIQDGTNLSVNLPPEFSGAAVSLKRSTNLIEGVWSTVLQTNVASTGVVFLAVADIPDIIYETTISTNWVNCPNHDPMDPGAVCTNQTQVNTTNQAAIGGGVVYYCTSANSTLDSDSDGLDNVSEYGLGTDYQDSDSDNDGMPDGYEVDNGFDPLLFADGADDPDADSLINSNEYLQSTLPNDADTDKDGLPDGWEVQNGLDPLNAFDAAEDPDNDGFITVYEYANGTDFDDYSSVPSPTRYISLTGSHIAPYSTPLTAATNIQAALDAATNDFEIICMAEGNYSGAGNHDLLFPTNPVMLFSESPAADCIIECKNSAGQYGNAFSCSGVTGGFSVLKNLTLKGGGGSTSIPIQCSSSKLLISGCLIKDLLGSQGLVSELESNSCLFMKDVVASYLATADESHQCFMHVNSSDVELQRCEILHSCVGFSLAGDSTLNGSATRIRCVASNKLYSTGIQLLGDNEVSGMILDGHESGIECILYPGSARIQNCVILNNQNGICLPTVCGDIEIRNCTIKDNNIGIQESEIFIPISEMVVQNSIVWGNQQQICDTNLLISSSCVQGGWPGSNNISADPLLALEYNLSLSSPCINAGNTNTVLTLDVDGYERDAVPDMGAAEYIDLNADSDGDGLPDWWELRYGLSAVSTNGINGAGGDFDGDGLDNGFEYSLQSSPSRANSRQTISPTVETRSIEISMPKFGFKDFDPNDPDRRYLEKTGSYDRDFAYTNGADTGSEVISRIETITHTVNGIAQTNYTGDYSLLSSGPPPGNTTSSMHDYAKIGTCQPDGSFSGTESYWADLPDGSVFVSNPFNNLTVTLPDITLTNSSTERTSGLVPAVPVYFEGDEEYAEILTNEHTTAMLTSNTLWSLVYPGSIMRRPHVLEFDLPDWSAGKRYSFENDLWDIVAAETTALRDLSPDETTLTVRKVQYRLRFDSEKDVVYTIQLYQLFTPEDGSDPQLTALDPIYVLGTGQEKTVDPVGSWVYPPETDGTLEVFILSVDIVSVDATDDIGPTKINYRVNPSGVSVPSMTFTAPGITETRADVSGDFYFTYNQSDLPYGESQITLEYLGCEAVLTVNKEEVGTGQTEEIIIATIPVDPGWVHWPISHRLSEGYARITYSGAPVLPDSYTLHVGGSHVTLEADETVTIDWAHEKHRYHDDDGTYNEQAMTLYTGGPTLPPTTAYRKFYDSTDDRFFIPGKNLEGIAQMESVSLDGILPLNLANENIDQELE